MSAPCQRGSKPSIDDDVGSGDVAGSVAGQEEHGVGDLLRAGEAACRGAGHSLLRDGVGSSPACPSDGGSYPLVAEPERWASPGPTHGGPL